MVKIFLALVIFEIVLSFEFTLFLALVKIFLALVIFEIVYIII
jgi:hypothetical protein